MKPRETARTVAELGAALAPGRVGRLCRALVMADEMPERVRELQARLAKLDPKTRAEALAALADKTRGLIRTGTRDR